MKIHLLQMMQNLEIHKQMVLPVGTLTKCREITTDVTGTTYKEETRGNVIDKTGEKGSNGVTQDSYKK